MQMTTKSSVTSLYNTVDAVFKFYSWLSFSVGLCNQFAVS